MTVTTKPSTMHTIIDAWKKIIKKLHTPLLDSSSITTPSEESIIALANKCISPILDDVSARNNTIELGTMYSSLSKEMRASFFNVLLIHFSTDDALISTQIANYHSNHDGQFTYEMQQNLIKTLTPTRIKILKQFVSLENGLYFLIKMREDVLNISKTHKHLKPIASDIFNILVHWFDVALLDIKQITWDSSASLLENLILYEAVHEIKSWNDLRNRLESDRQCFAFFHHKVSPSEPLVFVEVALSNTISNNIQHILDESSPNIDPHQANTATFYSISNTQKGLSGISLGNFLIKTVVSRIIQQYPNISRFITLSPIPTLCKWLLNLNNQDVQKIIPKKHYKSLLSSEESFNSLLNSFLADPSQEDLCTMLQPILPLLAKHYILHVKSSKNSLKAADPVTNFHISNGAKVLQINWLADTSAKGIKQSAGLMVNYQYILDEIESNHTTYILHGTIKH